MNFKITKWKVIVSVVVLVIWYYFIIHMARPIPECFPINSKRSKTSLCDSPFVVNNIFI